MAKIWKRWNEYIKKLYNIVILGYGADPSDKVYEDPTWTVETPVLCDTKNY